jgi:hypothetical protein
MSKEWSQPKKPLDCFDRLVAIESHFKYFNRTQQLNMIKILQKQVKDN